MGRMSDQKEQEIKKPKSHATKWVLGILGGIGIILLVIGLSVYAGYQSAMKIREENRKLITAAALLEQFNLGLADVETGELDRARQRFEFIIRNDPEFPGATEQLTQILVKVNTIATPTAAPLPTLVPTQDTRGVDERFLQAEQSILNSEWTNAIDTLLMLRKDDPTFKAVQIDGLLFMALRNRGMDKIGKQSDLEGGIYDLALAERFGPLDTEAQSYLNWARLYITGASFWEINWAEAVNYFSQIAPQLPYLRDGSGLTAMERYRLALIGLGISQLQSEPCDAVETLNLALSIADDEEAAKALEEAVKFCEGGGSGRGNDDNRNLPTVEPQPTDPVIIPPTEAPLPTPYP